MGVSKTDLFTDEQNAIAEMAKLFANPARVAIIEYLLSANSCINGTLVHELGLAQSTISQHLKELKNAGIIQGSIEGNSMCYCINSNKWQEVRLRFARLFDSYKNQNECC